MEKDFKVVIKEFLEKARQAVNNGKVRLNCEALCFIIELDGVIVLVDGNQYGVSVDGVVLDQSTCSFEEWSMLRFSCHERMIFQREENAQKERERELEREQAMRDEKYITLATKLAKLS